MVTLFHHIGVDTSTTPAASVLVSGPTQCLTHTCSASAIALEVSIASCSHIGKHFIVDYCLLGRELVCTSFDSSKLLIATCSKVSYLLGYHEFLGMRASVMLLLMLLIARSH